ncbi:MAG: PP2C family serine/threonine-protein phosphatase [Candidatus Nanopelagicales bacterium]
MGYHVNWRVIGASVAGTSHLRLGRACQDSHAFGLGERGVWMAVCDGAGSRSRSEQGARTALQALSDLFAERAEFGRRPVQGEDEQAQRASLLEILAFSRQAIFDLAQAEQQDPCEYACTLAMILVAGERAWCAQIGDGYVFLADSHQIRAVSPEPAGGYVNETNFLTAENWMSRVRTDLLDVRGVTGIALSTDGLRYKIVADLATGEPFGPFFEDVFDYARRDHATSAALGRFLLALPNDQSGDDKTLVAAIRLPTDDDDVVQRSE